MAESSRDYYDRSLRNSLDYFCGIVRADGRFDASDYDQALRSNAVVLGL